MTGIVGGREPVPADPGADSSLLLRIQRALPELRRSERVVADFVLRSPAEMVRMSIAEVALKVGVSQPTVARFADALGFTGFKALKISLARSLATGVPYVHSDVDPGDSIEAVGAKVFDRCIGTLMSVRNHLDHQQLGRAVELLAEARQLEIYGVGNSGIVALDAQHKLFRLRRATVAYQDSHTIGMAAALLSAGDVVLAISATGRSNDLITALEIARDSGAEVVAITHSDSPVARLASAVLFADVPENADLYAPMSSRLAHLAILDVLVVGVALKLGPELASRLRKAKQTVLDKRVGQRVGQRVGERVGERGGQPVALQGDEE